MKQAWQRARQWQQGEGQIDWRARQCRWGQRKPTPSYGRWKVCEFKCTIKHNRLLYLMSPWLVLCSMGIYQRSCPRVQQSSPYPCGLSHTPPTHAGANQSATSVATQRKIHGPDIYFSFRPSPCFCNAGSAMMSPSRLPIPSATVKSDASGFRGAQCAWKKAMERPHR